MSMVVAYTSDGRGRAAIHLGALLARSAEDDLVVCAVVPSPPFPSVSDLDKEYRDIIRRRAEQSLQAAHALIPDDVPATLVVREARSAAVGLLEEAEEREASMIVLGPSSSGAFGHIALGSVTGRLLHTSSVPLALASRGFRCKPGGRVTRVTAAYSGTAQTDDLVVAAAAVAAQVGAGLRIATFAVRAPVTLTQFVGDPAEDAVITEWAKQVQAARVRAIAHVLSLPDVPHMVEDVLGQGTTWAEAVDDVEWRDGDVLTVGSSSAGPGARVFLGSRATKIIRCSPVPVVVVPWPAAVEVVQEVESQAG